MYKILNGRLSKDLISKARNLIGDKYRSKESRHFTSSGKTFFYENPNRLLLLRNIILNVLQNNPEIKKSFSDLHIDHAFLLLKSPGGNETPPHQDRPFWTKLEKDDSVSMITLWFALEDIKELNGCLKVGSSNQHCLIDFNGKNQKLFKHKDKGSKSGQFNFIIDDNEFDLKLNNCEIDEGQIIAFDAYEVHASSGNSSSKHRLSFKIVLRDNDGLISIRDLESNPLFYLLKTFFKKLVK